MLARPRVLSSWKEEKADKKGKLAQPWIAEKVSELLGFEDDVVVEYVSGMLEDKDNRVCSSFILPFISLSLNH